MHSTPMHRYSNAKKFKNGKQTNSDKYIDFCQRKKSANYLGFIAKIGVYDNRLVGGW